MKHDPNAGPTGEPGNPDLAPNANHALRFAVTLDCEARCVVLDFGEDPISWVAIPEAKIRALVVALLEAAVELAGG